MDRADLDQEECEEDQRQSKTEGVEGGEDRAAKRACLLEGERLHRGQSRTDTWRPTETEEKTKERCCDDALDFRCGDRKTSIEAFAEDEDEAKQDREGAEDLGQEIAISKQSRTKRSEEHAVGDEERSETYDEEH